MGGAFPPPPPHPALFNATSFNATGFNAMGCTFTQGFNAPGNRGSTLLDQPDFCANAVGCNAVGSNAVGSNAVGYKCTQGAPPW